MKIVPTIRYTAKTRLYEIVELIVLDDGEYCIGDVIEVAGFTMSEAWRCYRKVKR